MDTDEKECPFCAEVIKAKATRCKFCKSDLPESPKLEQAEKQAQDAKLEKQAAQIEGGCNSCCLLSLLFAMLGAGAAQMLAG